MSLNDPLASALSKILNAEKIGKNVCSIRPVSNIVKTILTLMQDNLYIGGFTQIDEGRGGVLNVNLLGRINKCGVIKPRFPVTRANYEKFEKRYLPAKDFGLVFVSTSKGIMSHTEAKKKKLGGKLLAYVY